MQDNKKNPPVDELLTPEEEHRIEVRVDKMLSIDQPASSAPKVRAAKTAKSPRVSKKLPVITVSPQIPVAEVVEPPAEAVVADVAGNQPEAPPIDSELLPAEPETPAVPTAPAVPSAPPLAEPLAEIAAEPLAEPVTVPPAETAVEPPVAADVPEDEIAKLAAEAVASEQAASADTPASAPPAAAPLPPAATDTSGNADTADEVDDLSRAFADANPPGRGSNLKRLLTGWWHNRKARRAILGCILVLLIAGLAWPTSRAWAFNTVGIRAGATVTVLDGSTQLPLQGVHIIVGSAAADTNAKGTAQLTGIKLGNQLLKIQKIAFAPVSETLQVKPGSNAFGTVILKAVGAQYKLAIVDYASGQAVTGAMAASGQATAEADKQGIITLTVPDQPADTFTVHVTAPGYRTQQATIPVDAHGTTTVQMITSRKEIYVSKQSGKYDVYSIDIDGQNKQPLLKATGNETDTIQLVAHPAANEAALVDSRDNIHDNGGYLLQTLTVLNADTGAPTTVDHSQKVQIIDWFADRLVYALVKAGASAANPSRYQLMSYDYKTGQKQELDHANAFNDVVSAGGSIYYATSNQYNGGTSQFMKINADGSGKQSLLANEIWNVYRTGYNTLALVSGNSNYSYKIGDAKPVDTSNAYSGNSRLYIDSPDGKHSLWVDSRDGKGALVLYNTSSQNETVIAEVAGLDYPVRWLGNDAIIYRLHTPKETADYVTSVAGGTAKKITDVTPTTGITRWYFY